MSAGYRAQETTSLVIIMYHCFMQQTFVILNVILVPLQGPKHYLCIFCVFFFFFFFFFFLFVCFCFLTFLLFQTIREGMGQQANRSNQEWDVLDTVITNALIVDAVTGIIKADIGIKVC